MKNVVCMTSRYNKVKYESVMWESFVFYVQKKVDQRIQGVIEKKEKYKEFLLLPLHDKLSKSVLI